MEIPFISDQLIVHSQMKANQVKQPHSNIGFCNHYLKNNEKAKKQFHSDFTKYLLLKHEFHFQLMHEDFSNKFCTIMKKNK